MKRVVGDLDVPGDPVAETLEVKGVLGGGFKHFFFSPLFEEDSHFD